MIRAFFAGFLIFNGIPHLVQGISGKTHMTLFKRVSSPIVNVVWAFVNIAFGVLVLGMTSLSVWSFLLGGFLLSLTAAKLFGGPNAKLPWHKD